MALRRVAVGTLLVGLAQSLPAVSFGGGPAAAGSGTGGGAPVSQVGGDATFAIPIEVPPGTAGLTPSVALHYSSGSRRDSWVGYGWTLQTSSLRRSLAKGTPNYIDDGGTRYCHVRPRDSLGVLRTCSQDADCGAGDFCLAPDTIELDGEPLVFDGAAGAYRTQRQSFLHIVRNGDDSWTVTQPDGRRMRYGVSANGRLLHAGWGKPFEWLIESEEEPSGGNLITYTYAQAGGIAYPEEIRYGDGAQRVVRFNRDATPRPDQPVSYLAGFEQLLTQRLASITVQVGSGPSPSALLRTYSLEYIQGPDSLRTLLKEVEETGVPDPPNPAPVRRTTFTYSTNGTKGWGTATNWPVSGTGIWIGSDSRIADANGDGLADILVASSSTNRKLFLNTGSSFELSHDYPLPQFSAGDPVDFASGTTGEDFADLDGDGRADAIGRRMDGSAGNFSFDEKPNWIRSVPGGWTDAPTVTNDPHLSTLVASSSSLPMIGSVMQADLNGDGAPELVVRGFVRFTNQSGCVRSRRAGYFYWNLGGLQFLRAQVTDGNPPNCPNGTFTSGSEYTAGGAYGPPTSEIVLDATDGSLVSNEPRHLQYADVNGDGLADFHWTDVGGGTPVRQGFLNLGDRTFALRDDWRIPTDLVAVPYTDRQVRLADVNGDGRADVLRAQLGSARQAWLGDGDTNEGSTESAWVASGDWLPPVDFGANVALVDVNGDGMTDIAYTQATDLKVHVNQAKIPDLLTQVSTPLGATTKLEYATSASAIDPAVSPFPNSDAADVGYLPFVKPTVKAVEVDPGAGGSVQRREYSYVGGSYDPVTREFLGFARVTEVVGKRAVAGGFESKSHRVVTTFHTTSDRAGLPSEVLFEANTGGDTYVPRRHAVITYGPTAPHLRLPICSVQEEIETGGSRLIGVETVYDANGNPTEIRRKGLVANTSCTDDTSDAARTLEIAYASDAAGRLRDRPYRVRLWENPATGAPILRREILLSYDNLALGAVSAGLLTQQVRVQNPGSASPTGPTLRFLYDAKGRLLERTNAREIDGSLPIRAGTALWVYAPAHPDLLGELRSEAYNAGNPSTPGDEQRLVTTFSYDQDPNSLCGVAMPPEAGLPRLEVDPNGIPTKRCYDELGRLEAETTFDLQGNEVAKTTVSYVDTPGAVSIHVTRYVDGDPSHLHTESRYLDGLGRVTAVARTGPAGTTIVEGASYDAYGRLAAATLPGSGSPGAATTFLYDALGRELQRTLPGSNRIWLSRYSLDLQSRLVQELEDPDGDLRQQVSDAFGNTVEVSELEASGTHTTSYAYNVSDQLTTVTDPATNVIQFGYDTLGRQTTLTDPDVGSWSFQYDANDNAILQEGPLADDTLTWAYDALDRRTSENSATGVSYSWVYDGSSVALGKGRLWKEIGHDTLQVYSYHPLGGATKERYTIANKYFELETSYDQLGQVSTRKYPNGRVVTWGKDAGGYTSQITTATGSTAEQYATNIAWHPSLRLSAWTAGNGRVTSYGFDATTQRLQSFAVDSLESRTYGYTPADQLSTISGSMTASFQYDDLGRLKEATGPFASGYAQTTLYYGYDTSGLGNLTCLDATASGAGCTGGRSFTYPSGTQPVRPHAPLTIGGANATYDAAGNLLSHGTRSYLYNPRGQLREVKESGATIGTMKYRADGKALEIVSGGRTRHRFTDDFEYDWTNAKSRIQVRLAGQVIAIHEEAFTPPDAGGGGCASVGPLSPGDEPPPGAYLGGLLLWGALAWATLRLARATHRRPPAAIARRAVACATGTAFLAVVSVPAGLGTSARASSPADVTYFHGDQLGSSVLSTDALGGHTRAVYRPFGALVPDGTATVPERGFTGQRFERDLGIYDYNARWYDPALGHFLQPDALIPDVYDPQALNPFAYVRNDPVNLTDPSGNFEVGFTGFSIYFEFGLSSGIPSSSFGPLGGTCAYTTGSHPLCDGSLSSLIGSILAGVLGGGGWHAGQAAWSPGFGGVLDALVGVLGTVGGLILNDISSAGVGGLYNVIDILGGLGTVLSGIVTSNVEQIGSGIRDTINALVPRYGPFAGPGHTILGAKERNVIDRATRKHDLEYRDLDPRERFSTAATPADKQLIRDIWSAHDVGPIGQLYRIGLTAAFGLKIGAQETLGRIRRR